MTVVLPSKGCGLVGSDATRIRKSTVFLSSQCGARTTTKTEMAARRPFREPVSVSVKLVRHSSSSNPPTLLFLFFDFPFFFYFSLLLLLLLRLLSPTAPLYCAPCCSPCPAANSKAGC